MAIPAASQRIHGIDGSMLAGAPHIARVLDSLAPMLDGAVFVAQNSPFDLGFLGAATARLGLPDLPVGPVMCTLALARHVFALPKCNLAALAARTGVPQPDAHRALADAQTTLGVYRAFARDLIRDGVPTVSDLHSRIENRRKGGPARRRVLDALTAAFESGQRVTIDYTARLGVGALTSRRDITVQAVRPPYVDAWCHLRDQDRVFRLDRIQWVRTALSPR
jgi:DNA polymerase-3 subunit epsilon